MKTLLAILVTALIYLLSAVTFAAEGPTCVMMRFSNDTRFQDIDSASVLSDLVIEKILASEKFNLVETNPIDKDMEALLYNEKTREIINAQSAMDSGNFNVLFEGPGFDPTQAESIATAKVGQIITPSITSAIGKDNNAEYIIEGTIINMGNGSWDDYDHNIANGLAALVVGIFSRSKSSEMFSSSPGSDYSSAIVIQCDLRIIKASTGEVIWLKDFTGYAGKKASGYGASKESVKLDSEAYERAMNFAAEEIVKGLIKDLEAGKLFTK